MKVKFKNIFSGLLVFLLLSTAIFASDNNVATVLLKRGNVKAVLLDGKTINIKMNQTLPEGAKLVTSEKSYVKLIFIDKSTINVGPSSEMLIQAFPKKEAGIIKLIRGQIRAEVTKNYMEMDDKSKSKLYIQTKSAAMGIRGTDFQVNYNPANNNSTLIVFEGKVAMGHIDRANQNAILAQRSLENLVSNNTAVFVKQGQFSAVNLSISDRATIPTKLAPKQLDALKENTTGIVEDTKNSKKVRDTVPPGVDSSAFINSPASASEVEIKEAAGFFNEKTHEYKPTAGAVIDLNTVNVIAPATDAKFDQVTKTFVISENYGKIDEKSGKYISPVGYKLSDKGQFEEVRPKKNNSRHVRTSSQDVSVGPNNSGVTTERRDNDDNRSIVAAAPVVRNDDNEHSNNGNRPTFAPAVPVVRNDDDNEHSNNGNRPTFAPAVPVVRNDDNEHSNNGNRPTFAPAINAPVTTAPATPILAQPQAVHNWGHDDDDNGGDKNANDDKNKKRINRKR